jgi:hypothetical protein
MVSVTGDQGYQLLKSKWDTICGVMVSMLALSAVSVPELSNQRL